jgi:hypothetical protein
MGATAFGNAAAASTSYSSSPPPPFTACATIPHTVAAASPFEAGRWMFLMGSAVPEEGRGLHTLRTTKQIANMSL